MGLPLLLLTIAVMVSIGGGGGGGVAAEEEVHRHHVVGAERGWDPYADTGSWSSSRNFRVGDKIWFTYHAAQGTIVEVGTKEEYEACNVGNPIRMFPDGLDAISLEQEGIRYFANSNSAKCKSGLKLHVDVSPQDQAKTAVSVTAAAAAAAAAPLPSGAAHLKASFALLLVGFWLYSSSATLLMAA